MVPSPQADFVLFQRSKSLSEATVRNRSSILHTFELVMQIPAEHATLRDLRTFLTRPTVKSSSKRTERNALRTFFQFLLEEGYRDDDPSIKLVPIKVPKGTPRPFAPQQIDAMLASGAYKRTRAMILLGYYQGLRVSSIARVHGHDIDLLTDTIHVQGKGEKVAALPLHPTIRELAQHMPAHAFWFPARRGQPGHIKGSGVTTLIAKAKQRAGILDPLLTAHSLRHAFGSDLVEEGVDIRVIQELLMHEDISSTQIYTRVSELRKREAIITLAPREIPDSSGRRPMAS